MALDKQKILSELGNVMNQLKSADCGCMGKLFGNTTSTSNVSNSPVSGRYDYGCCHCHSPDHFYGTCSGEPCSSMPNQHMNQLCMNHCNPAKLYSDTYQYLNNNVMQPVVEEVYNDLKTMTPANTVMNNQTINALNTSQGYINMKNKENMSSGHLINPYSNQGLNLEQSMSNMNGKTGNINELGVNTCNLGGCMSPRGNHISASAISHINGPGGHTGAVGERASGFKGMSSIIGPNIANMMTSGQKPNRNEKPITGSALTQPMVIDAPQSPHGQIGIAPMPAQISPQQKPNRPMLATNQRLENYNGNFNNSNINMSHVHNVEKPVQQVTQNHNFYGQHAHGIAKFNEMFPGVMKNFGGDLNFDPMAIAVQMNPANQQRAAIDTMQRAMSGNNAGINKMLLPPSIGQTANENTPTDGGIAKLNDSPIRSLQNERLENASNAHQLSASERKINQEQLNYTSGNEPHQRVYTATGKTSLQHEDQEKDQQSLQQTYQQKEPNTDDSQPLLEPVRNLENTQIEKEPIFPANVSHNQVYSHTKGSGNYTYNTLGQPIEMLPARNYHVKDLSGPQTLSPQNLPPKSIHDPRLFSNVKSTVSKTSIMGNRTVGKNPSRSQLQHIHKQYKGSQSLTQQNVISGNQGGSHSEGMLNVSEPRAKRNVPDQQVFIEKIGGDILPENKVNFDAGKYQVVEAQNGDVGNINKFQNNATTENLIPNRNSKARNGLQDIVYTSYPTSAAWSFHGHTRPSFSIGLRNKTQL